MDLMERHNIKNIEGTLMYKDTPLVEFCIVNYNTTYVKELNRKENFCIYPVEFMFDDAVTYGDLNDFFKHHVVQDGAQDIMEYLHALGLKHYDLDEIVKRKNGYNHVGYYWVKFKNRGATCWEEIRKQKYPIYK